MSFSFRMHLPCLFVSTFLAVGSTGCAGGASAPSEAKAPRSATTTNAVHFHLVDFLGWNNQDWDVMREYHTADVKVVMGATKTEGIEAHIHGLEQMISQMPNTFITNHRPVVVDGDWNCTVGVVASMNFKMATVAKFRAGAISEEYLFMKQKKPGEVSPRTNQSPLVDIATRDDLRRAAGVEPGWRCVMNEGADGNLFVVFSKPGNEDLVFGN